jgi:hypothetical protein
MDDALMDAQALSERLGLPRWKIFNLTAQGVLPVVRMGRRLYYDRFQIEDFIAQGGRAFVRRGAGVE